MAAINAPFRGKQSGAFRHNSENSMRRHVNDERRRSMPENQNLQGTEHFDGSVLVDPGTDYI